MFPNRKIRIFVRNKAKYNPVSKEYGFLHVDVLNYAGTTIGDIKENVKKQCRNSLKLDDLFLNNEKLSDERSVAHYNLQDGTILESTSNPFWVSCLHIKQYEVEKTKQDNPNDKAVQGWTTKSINRKRTLLSVLMNSKNEYPSQPPHFPTVDDFVVFLELLNKKGARMNPLYTQRDLQDMYNDYCQNYLGQYGDPLGEFLLAHAVRLGLKQQGDNHGTLNNGRPPRGNNPGPAGPHGQTKNRRGAPTPNEQNLQRRANSGPKGRKERTCEDCEERPAEVYCPDCQNAVGGQGLALCQICSTNIHRGAVRRGHTLQDIDAAPKISKPYVPHAFKAPFALLVALYSGMTARERILSMTEDEVKNRAQPLTDTDLSDKQNGRYVGGFECMENCLIAKHLVQREDSINPTYALTETGYQLANKCFRYQQAVQRFLRSHDFPVVPQNISTACGTRKLCLIIDEQERDRGRFLQLAGEWGIDAQVRGLPAGDYIWILSPPVMDPAEKYQIRQPTLEKVLPFIVERKGWEDLDDSVRTKRFHKQVIRMLDSGMKFLFYLMEGSISSLRYRTEQQLKRLKDELQNIFKDNGFYINYTASWFKTATWLRWFTEILATAVNSGMFRDPLQTYAEFCRRANVPTKTTTIPRTDFRKVNHTVWTGDQFVDNIFRESRHLQTVVSSVKDELSAPAYKQLLIIQGLEAYNKKRQTLQNKFLLDTCDNPDNTEDLVEEKFTTSCYNMVHYDIMCYRQLQIQIVAQIYVARTESKQDTDQIKDQVNANNENITREGNNNNIMLPQEPTRRSMPRTDQSKDSARKRSPRKNSDNKSSPPKRKSRNRGSGVSRQTGNGDSSEDEDLKRALELSRQCAEELERATAEFQNSRSKPINHAITNENCSNFVVRGRAADNSNINLSDSQEELQLVLEMSKQDVTMDTKVLLNDSQEELQHVLEMSKQNVAMDTAVPLNDSQEELQHVLQMSKKRVTMDTTVSLNDSQDHELQEALKLSRLEQQINKHGRSNDVTKQGQSTSHNFLDTDTSSHIGYAVAENKKNLDISDRASKDTMSSRRKKVDFGNEKLVLRDSQDDELQQALKFSLLDQSGSSKHDVQSNAMKGMDSRDRINANIELDGAEEMKLALVGGLSKYSCDDSVEKLSEEEQLRLVIEQSKAEANVYEEPVREPVPLLGKCHGSMTRDVGNSIQDCLPGSCVTDAILIDSQGTEYGDSCVEVIEDDSQVEGLEEIPHKSECETPDQACQQLSSESLQVENDSESVVSGVTYTKNENRSENLFVSSQVEALEGKATERRCEHDKSKNEAVEENSSHTSDSKCAMCSVNNRKGIEEDLEENRFSNSSLKSITLQNEEIICKKGINSFNILVEDSQVGDINNDDGHVQGESVTVPDTVEVGVDDNEVETNDEIDVIPPSPEQNMSVSSLKLTSNEKEKDVCIEMSKKQMSPEQNHLASSERLSWKPLSSDKENGICTKMSKKPKSPEKEKQGSVGTLSQEPSSPDKTNPVSPKRLSKNTLYGVDEHSQQSQSVSLLDEFVNGGANDTTHKSTGLATGRPDQMLATSTIGDSDENLSQKIEPVNMYDDEHSQQSQSVSLLDEFVNGRANDTTHKSTDLATGRPDQILATSTIGDSDENLSQKVEPVNMYDDEHSQQSQSVSLLDEFVEGGTGDTIAEKLTTDNLATGGTSSKAKLASNNSRKTEPVFQLAKVKQEKEEKVHNVMNHINISLKAGSSLVLNVSENTCRLPQSSTGFPLDKVSSLVTKDEPSSPMNQTCINEKGNKVVSVADDEELARKLQEEINKELEMEERMKNELKRRQTRSLKNAQNDVHLDQKIDCSNDEEIARKLQESLNKGENSKIDNNDSKRLLRKRKLDYQDSQEEMFFSLQEVISQQEAESEIRAKVKCEEDDLKLAKQMQENNEFTQTNVDGDYELAQRLYNENSEDFFHGAHEKKNQLKQRLEQEKEDRRLAQTLQQEANGRVASNSPTKHRPLVSTQQAVEMIWDKKIKDIQKSKTSLQSQLQEIRKDQNARYKGMSGFSGQSSSMSSNIGSPVVRTFYGSTTSGSTTRTNPSKKNATWQGPEIFDDEDSLPDLYKTDDFKTVSPPSTPNDRKFSFPSSSATSGKTDNPLGLNQNSSATSQNASSPSCSQGNMGHVTCGNCGQKGHTRIWVQCPRYHSFEETQHRQKKENEKKRRIEEEENRKQQTKDELERHKTTLEEIARQIVQETTGIERTIKKLDKKTKTKKKR